MVLGSLRSQERANPLSWVGELCKALAFSLCETPKGALGTMIGVFIIGCVELCWGDLLVSVSRIARFSLWIFSSKKHIFFSKILPFFNNEWDRSHSQTPVRSVQLYTTQSTVSLSSK